MEFITYSDSEPKHILLYRNKAYDADKIMPEHAMIVIIGFTQYIPKNDKNSPIKLHERGTPILARLKNKNMKE